MTVFDVIVLVTLLATGFAWVELLVRAGRVRRLAKALAASDRRLDEASAALAQVQQALAGQGEQVAALNRQLDKLRERQGQLELRDPETGTYAQAIRLVRRGADADELVAGCGLSRGEAELVLALHGKEHTDGH